MWHGLAKVNMGRLSVEKNTPPKKKKKKKTTKNRFRKGDVEASPNRNATHPTSPPSECPFSASTNGAEVSLMLRAWHRRSKKSPVARQNPSLPLPPLHSLEATPNTYRYRRAIRETCIARFAGLRFALVNHR